MALNKDRLKKKLKKAFQNPKTQSNIDAVADEVATAIIEEIKELKLNYTSGLVAPNGAVTGSLTNVTIS